MSSPDSLLVRLAAAGVDFVVIGGIAVIAHGHIRTTLDTDITYSTEPDNLSALGGALVELDARLRGVAELVPFVPDGRTLRATEILTLTTAAGPLDLLASPPGGPPYPELRERAQPIELDGREVRVASIEDLLAMKRAAGLPQDLIDVEALEAIQRIGREASS